MLDTQLFQMLVLFFKIFFYSAEMEEATVDMIDNPGYHMSYQFEQGEHTLEIMPIIDSVPYPEGKFSVRTVDNGLYEVDLGSDEFTLDLASEYQSLDWDHLTDKDMEITADYGDRYYLLQGSDSIYLVNDGGRLMVLSRKYIE